MRLRLLASGLEIDVPLPRELRGRARSIAAAECENQRRTNGSGNRLRLNSADGAMPDLSGGARIPSKLPYDTTVSPDAPNLTIEQQVRRALAYDLMVSDPTRARLRRKLRAEVSRKHNDAWLQEQMIQPGSVTPARLNAYYDKLGADLVAVDEALLKSSVQIG